MRINDYKTYLQPRFDLDASEQTADHVISGKLIERRSGKEYMITRGIPRMVDSLINYSRNFGFQWNTFRQVQLDSHTGLPLSHDRLFSNTKWSKEELKSKVILEVGSGAGRFTEILADTGAFVVSFDYSAAVEANYHLNGHRNNLFLFQGDIYDMPFPDDFFDYVFCYGVLQHTPDPARAFQYIFQKLKQGGKISIDYYLNPEKPSVWTTPKYFWRPLTVKMNPVVLLWIIRSYMFFWFHIDTLIKKLPGGLGFRILSRIPVPCYNYLGSGLTYMQRWQWAVLDTLDALSARYDFPKTRDELDAMISLVNSSEKELFYGSNGLVANLTKA